MAWTVKQVAAASGVSVRTLHFYHETGLLEPAYVGDNGYRFYEEAQLLTLQQILFYRELGFELKEIQQVLRREDFEKVAALRAHREALTRSLAQTSRLIETVDKTVRHLTEGELMGTEEMFVGFRVAAGEDRFADRVLLGGEPSDCKVSGRDTGGAMCAFEFTGAGGGPLHLHYEQDEWVYVVAGELDFRLGDARSRVGPGDCVFVPRGVAHAWTSAGAGPGKVVDVYQPAGRMEEFFRAVGRFGRTPAVHEVLSLEELHRLFHDHGMDLLGPPLTPE